METTTRYEDHVTSLAGHLGSLRAVARSLGVTHGTLDYRLKHPGIVRNESMLAVEVLLQRIER